MKTISLDAMGGDFGPKVVIPAALRVLGTHSDVSFIFVGDEAVLTPLLKAKGQEWGDRWEIQHASEVVAMDESPASALRGKKDSSMRVAINLVKEGRAQACVSAGNTGALMATARFVLKTLPGIDRPAIMTQFPTRKEGKEVRMLDLGANVDSSAEHLYQFAVMGSIVAGAVDGIASPKVGLLNIGEEEIKGNEQVKKTAELLSNSDAINYIGYVEGDAIFTGQADVIVCDGFVGNVTLKACEGIAKLIVYFVRQSFQANWKTKIAATLTKPVLKRLMSRIDPRRRNGATLVGLDGIVVKSHGSAGVMAFANAVEEAIIEIEKNVPEEIRRQVNQALSNNSKET